VKESEDRLSWRPKLRPLQTNLYEGVVLLSDPMGVSPYAVSLSPAAALLVGLMDGRRTVRDITEEYVRLTGDLITYGEVLSLVEKLDRWYMLDNERFREEYDRLNREFLRRGVRPYVFAGESYPADPVALRSMVAVAHRRRGVGEVPLARGVVMPHIDPRRGWRVYLEGLRAVERNRSRTYVIIGVAHSPISHPVQVLPMDLDTPLGRVRVARDVVDYVISSTGFDLLSDPLAFSREHSVEFPVVFVKALHPDEEVEVVPLIVSDLGDNAEAIDEVMAHLSEALKGRDFLPVAAVDLSHAGPRFGDRYYDEAKVKHYDGEFMAAFETGVPESLLALYEEYGNPTNIDAFGATYALMRLLEGDGGKVLAYEISYEDETSSAVSFMAGTLT